MEDQGDEAPSGTAHRSTGPRTEAGKRASSMNALKHGLSALRVVLPDEDQAEYDAFRAGLVAAIAPADEVERDLAERIAVTAWRLRRAPFAELRFSSFAPKDAGAGAAIEYWTTQMNVLARYEGMLERALSRAYATLDRRRERAAAAAEKNAGTKRTPPDRAPDEPP
jgi:hypothetical protein